MFWNQMYKLNEDEVIKVSSIAKCGAEAARMLNVNYKVYRRVAKKIGCFKKDIGISMRGVRSRNALNKMDEFLKGKLNNARMSGGTVIRYLIESGVREYKCEVCGISEWIGKRIVLQAHHKDGNHFNNVPSNIAILCPNCHSQTDTFGSRNVKRYDRKRKSIIGKRHVAIPFISKCPMCGRERVTKRMVKDGSLCRACRNSQRTSSSKPLKDVLEKEVSQTSYISIGKKYGVSNTTIKRWCRSYGIMLMKRTTRPFG